VVGGYAQQRHAPGNWPAALLASSPPSPIEFLRRWRGLGEEEVFGGEPLERDQRADLLDTPLLIGFAVARMRRLFFVSVGLAHDDRRGRRTEERCDALDPLRGGLAEPTAVLTTVGAAQLTGMWSLAGADDAHVVAARPLALGVELHLEANEAVVGGGVGRSGRTRGREHVELRGHECSSSS